MYQYYLGINRYVPQHVGLVAYHPGDEKVCVCPLPEHCTCEPEEEADRDDDRR